MHLGFYGRDIDPFKKERRQRKGKRASDPMCMNTYGQHNEIEKSKFRGYKIEKLGEFESTTRVGAAFETDRIKN